jgi:hypothetical protein
MSGPVFAQHVQGARRQRDVAVLGSLATMNMNDHPLAVDIAGLQVQTFAGRSGLSE